MLLLLFPYAFVILLIEVYCNMFFMIPAVPLQLLLRTFAAAIAVVVVVPSLPFPFALHVSFLYSYYCQRPFLELS